MTTTATFQDTLFAVDDHGVRMFSACTKCGTPVAVDLAHVGAARPTRCRKCHGRMHTWAPVAATHHAGTRCDARCRNARGPLCECSCSGSGHGRGWLMTADELAEILEGMA